MQTVARLLWSVALLLGVLGLLMLLPAYGIYRTLGIDSWRRAIVGAFIMPFLAVSMVIFLTSVLRPTELHRRRPVSRRIGLGAASILGTCAVITLLVRYYWQSDWAHGVGTFAMLFVFSSVSVLIALMIAISLGGKRLSAIFFVFELSPKRFRERRIHCTVWAMTIDEAATAAIDYLREGLAFQVLPASGQQAALPGEVPEDVKMLLYRYAEIRTSDSNDLLLRRDDVGWGVLNGQRLLRLTAWEYCGPVVASDEAHGVELFEDEASLRKGIPWGAGWPTFSHYLVHRARTCTKKRSSNAVDSAVTNGVL